MLITYQWVVNYNLKETLRIHNTEYQQTIDDSFRYMLVHTDFEAYADVLDQLSSISEDNPNIVPLLKKAQDMSNDMCDTLLRLYDLQNPVAGAWVHTKSTSDFHIKLFKARLFPQLYWITNNHSKLQSEDKQLFKDVSGLIRKLDENLSYVKKSDELEFYISQAKQRFVNVLEANTEETQKIVETYEERYINNTK